MIAAHRTLQPMCEQPVNLARRRARITFDCQCLTAQTCASAGLGPCVATGR